MGWFNINVPAYSIGNTIVEIRQWSSGRIISTIGFPILVRWHLYIESVPRSLWFRDMTTYLLWHIQNAWRLLQVESVKWISHYWSWIVIEWFKWVGILFYMVATLHWVVYVLLISSFHWHIPSWSLLAKNGIFGEHNGNIRIRHFDLLEMSWHQPQTKVVTSMQFSRVVSWTRSVIYSVRNQDKL